jgi:organic hydroperoxide reductase OsmC/OhrA
VVTSVPGFRVPLSRVMAVVPVSSTCRDYTTELNVEAAVTLEREGTGFRISRSALTLRAQVPNIGQAAFARIAGEAEKSCRVSKVLNAAITLDAKLV